MICYKITEGFFRKNYVLGQDRKQITVLVWDMKETKKKKTKKTPSFLIVNGIKNFILVSLKKFHSAQGGTFSGIALSCYYTTDIS